MLINYVINSNKTLVSWTSFPLDKTKPTIEVADPNKLLIGIDKIIDGKVVRDEQAKKDFEQSIHKYERIDELKKQLAATDYLAIKFAEGELTAEDFTPIKAQRKAWREEINALEIIK